MKIELNNEYYVNHVQSEDKRNMYAQALFEKLRVALNAKGIKEKDYSLDDLRANDCFLLWPVIEVNEAISWPQQGGRC